MVPNVVARVDTTFENLPTLSILIECTKALESKWEPSIADETKISTVMERLREDAKCVHSPVRHRGSRSSDTHVSCRRDSLKDGE